MNAFRNFALALPVILLGVGLNWLAHKLLPRPWQVPGSIAVFVLYALFARLAFRELGIPVTFGGEVHFRSDYRDSPSDSLIVLSDGTGDQGQASDASASDTSSSADAGSSSNDSGSGNDS